MVRVTDSGLVRRFGSVGGRVWWEIAVFLRGWPGWQVALCGLLAVLVTGVLLVTVDFCVPERIQRLG